MNSSDTSSPIKQEIPYFDIEVENEDDYFHILKQIRPSWFEQNAPKITSKVFTGGIQNKLMGFSISKHDLVLMKMFGRNTEIMVDRDFEGKLMKVLKKYKCGPDVYARFKNGMAYDFIPGAPVDEEFVKNPAKYPLIALEFAKWHSIPHQELGSTNETTAIWDLTYKFINLAQENFDKNPSLKERLEKVGFTREYCENAVEELKNLIEKENMPIALCHNDLIYGNCIYDKESDHLSFIDFEYSFYNYTPFDIANHFCEFSGIENIDYTKCPDDDFMRRWIKVYLTKLQTSDPDDQAVETYLKWVKLCQPLSHFTWVLWAAVQIVYSDIDFDYEGYTLQRRAEYERIMEKARKL